MAEAAQTQMLDIDPDFEPLSRPRSCTWPLPRPEFPAADTSSPAPSAQQDASGPADFTTSLSLLEESEDYALCGDFQCQESCVHPQHQHQHQHQHHHQQQQVPVLSSPVPRKSSSSRRNAWGNMSYADLITKAIESSAEKRLTLSQIYDWMVKNVPYFKDKGDSNSSAGWKNSIRHNLSLHSRFMRVQNEGTGKSSWWMLNPEGGKSGKSPRRRAASMDNNSKFSKSRGRAAKKKLALQGAPDGGADSPGSQYSKWPGSPNSHSNDDFEAWTSFRPRTSSNASTLSGRLSPFIDDELSDPDVHMAYPGPGAKMTSTLPSLSEMAGSLSHSGSENVMENLLDNLNLLSPQNTPVGSTVSGSNPPAGPPVFSPFSPPSLASQAGPQDFRKCLYGQAGMGGLTMQPLAEGKPGFGPAPLGQFSCTAGLLKELLTSDSEPADIMGTVNPAVSQPGQVGRMYNSAPVGHPLRSLHALPRIGQGGTVKSSLQMQYGGGGGLLDRGLPPYCSISSNGYGRAPALVAHQHQQHLEKLPSDLDGMPLERFECDVESILHDTLMDGESLDFNFDPMATQQGFPPHSVKTTTHNWVSG